MGAVRSMDPGGALDGIAGAAAACCGACDGSGSIDHAQALGLALVGMRACQ